MSLGILGIKLGMTHVYDGNGRSIAVTVVDVSDCNVVQVKKKETNGYSAYQVGLGNRRESRSTKAAVGHCKKYGSENKQFLREFRVENEAALPEANAKLGVETFVEGQYVDAIAISKGKGFQGAVRRHNFKGQRQTHGSMMHRRTGAIGCRLTPGRVWKNQKMPGHMGMDHKTIQNLVIVGSRPEENLLLVSGSVPGAKGGLVMLRPAKKRGTPEEEKAKAVIRASAQEKKKKK